MLSKMPDGQDLETATISARIRRKTLLQLKASAKKKGVTLSALIGGLIDYAVLGEQPR